MEEYQFTTETFTELHFLRSRSAYAQQHSIIWNSAIQPVVVVEIKHLIKNALCHIEYKKLLNTGTLHTCGIKATTPSTWAQSRITNLYEAFLCVVIVHTAGSMFGATSWWNVYSLHFTHLVDYLFCTMLQFYSLGKVRQSLKQHCPEITTQFLLQPPYK